MYFDAIKELQMNDYNKQQVVDYLKERSYYAMFKYDMNVITHSIAKIIIHDETPGVILLEVIISKINTPHDFDDIVIMASNGEEMFHLAGSKREIPTDDYNNFIFTITIS